MVGGARRAARGLATLAGVGTLTLLVGACGSSSGGGTATSAVGEPSTSAAPAGLLPATDGRVTTVRTKVDVGGHPCGVAVGFGAVWVSVNDTAELIRLDPQTGERTGRIALDATPCEITATDDALWVVTQSGVVDRVDPTARKVTAHIATGDASYQAADAFGSIWVTNRNSQTITRIDPGTGKTSTIDLAGVNAGGIVAAAGALWVGDDATGSHRIVRVDPHILTVTDVEVGGDRPAYLAAAGNTVWVSQVRSGTVVAVDASTGRLTGEPIPAGASPVNLHASPDMRWVWVPDDATDFLTRIDAATGQAVERVKAGAGPAVVAPTDDGLWVTNFGDGTVWHLTTS